MPRTSQYSSTPAPGTAQSLPELLIPHHPRGTSSMASPAPSSEGEDDAFALQARSRPRQSWRSVSVSRRGDFSEARRRWHSFALLSTAAASPAIPKTHGSPPVRHSPRLLPPNTAPVPHRHTVDHNPPPPPPVWGHLRFGVPTPHRGDKGSPKSHRLDPPSGFAPGGAEAGQRRVDAGPAFAPSLLLPSNPHVSHRTAIPISP